MNDIDYACAIERRNKRADRAVYLALTAGVIAVVIAVIWG